VKLDLKFPTLLNFKVKIGRRKMKNRILFILGLVVLINSVELHAIIIHRSDIQAEMPNIVVMKNDDVLVTFVEGDHYTKNADIKYMVYYDDSGNWSKPQIAVKRRESCAFPQLAVDNDGDIHMVYMDGSSSENREIMYSVYSSGKWRAPKIVYENEGLNPSWPKIQIKDEKIYIMWTQNNGPSVEWGTDICFVTNNKGGDWPVEKEKLISISKMDPSISVFHDFKVFNNVIYCCWMDDCNTPNHWQINFNKAKYDIDSNDWIISDPKHLFPEEFNQYYPVIALDDNKGIHINFSAKYGPFYYSRRVGSEWNSPIALSQSCSLAIIPVIKFKRGLIHMVYKEITSTGEGLYYRSCTPDGNWKEPINITNTAGANFPSLDVDSRGNIHNVWSGGENIDKPRNIYYKKIKLSGSPPNAAIVSSKPYGLAPLTVDFNASNSWDENGAIIKYKWDFGDGARAEREKVSYTYEETGKYTASLTVVDNDFRKDTAHKQIVVSDGEPLASISASLNKGLVPLKVTFDASLSEDVDGNISSYDWNFGDGSSGWGKVVTHIYKNAGKFTAVLKVIDDDGKSDTSSIKIRVFQGPVAVFTANPSSGVLPLDVILDATESFDPEGKKISFLWDFNDGMTSNQKKILHTFNNPGIYRVVLIVTDKDGYSDTSSQDITVLVNKPFPPINVRVERKKDDALFKVKYLNVIVWERNNKNTDYFNISKYKIYRRIKEDIDYYCFIKEVSGTTFWYEDYGFSELKEADKYEYVVTAVDSQGEESDFSKPGSNINQ